MPSQPTPNLLIVDDTPANIRLLSALLTQEGYEIRKAIEGQMALTACQQRLPDLILLDVMMPEMDGYEVCQHLQENPQTAQIPVIFISALDDATDKVKAFEAGGVDYISKPFQKAEVLARVKNHLDLSRLRHELQRKNELLEKALEDTKKAEAQLIQSEKMSALGQLVGGIAHEINNPASFVRGNIDHADQILRDLFAVIDGYRRELPQPSPGLQSLIDDVELDFLKEDAPNLIAAIQRGAVRIEKVVQSLRDFVHLDEVGVKPTNLVKGIENTLFMLESRLRETPEHPEIKVLKDYQPLPLVNCYPGELNQVFLHLINNAVDAIKVKANQAELADPQLWIKTAVTANETIQIKIKDNGCGVPEASASRLFDPFFTTKPVGQAKGLGLAISYQIITEKHHGSLSYTSTSGVGTEFTIELPLNPLPPES